MYVCVYVCMYVCVYVSMDGWMYVCMHVCMLHLCTYVDIHTQTSTSQYTYRLDELSKHGFHGGNELCGILDKLHRIMDFRAKTRQHWRERRVREWRELRNKKRKGRDHFHRNNQKRHKHLSSLLHFIDKSIQFNSKVINFIQLSEMKVFNNKFICLRCTHHTTHQFYWLE